MNYSCEGEYNAAMQAQGEAEAEYQAHADYHNYLVELYENGEFKLYFLHTIADDLESQKFKESGKTPSEYLRYLISESQKTIEERLDSGELPF